MANQIIFPPLSLYSRFTQQSAQLPPQGSGYRCRGRGGLLLYSLVIFSPAPPLFAPQGGRPRVGQGSLCHWPCPQLQDRVHLRGGCAPLGGAPGLQLKSDCTPTVSDRIICPYNSYVGGFPGGPVVETPCLQSRGRQFDPWSGN